MLLALKVISGCRVVSMLLELCGGFGWWRAVVGLLERFV